MDVFLAFGLFTLCLAIAYLIFAYGTKIFYEILIMRENYNQMINASDNDPEDDNSFDDGGAQE